MFAHEIRSQIQPKAAPIMNQATSRRRKAPPIDLAEARRSGHYNIGQAAKVSGISAKMIRHYESIGLLPEAPRTFANYRVYSQDAIHVLQFIKRARHLGFSLKDIAVLLDLWNDQTRASGEVKALAKAHIDEMDQRIRELQTMRKTLHHLVQNCKGDDRPDCPILENFSSVEST